MCTTRGVIDQAQVRNKGLIRVHLSFLTVKSVKICFNRKYCTNFVRSEIDRTRLVI